MKTAVRSTSGEVARRDGSWAVAAFTWALSALALGQLLLQSYRSGVLGISPRWQAVMALGSMAVAAFGVLLLVARRAPVRRSMSAWIARLEAHVPGKLLSLVLIALVALIFPAAVFGFAGRYLEGLFPRLLLFWVGALGISILARAWFTEVPWTQRLLGTTVVYGLFVEALTFIPSVSTYPFSLGWSESSRYYYASLFFGPAIYGVRLNPPELHPTRYLLQSIPFLAAQLPLWTHRLWQVVLWWSLPAAAAALLVARVHLAGRWLRWLVGAWIVLYFFQGPVYYHLMVMVIIVLAAVDARHPWRSTLAVVAASVWAGLSRVNWYPVPALLAGCLVLLDLPDDQSDRRAGLRWPIVWVIAGTLVALASQAAYVRFTGIPVDRFTSSLTSQILLYRLLPNTTYALGILPAALLASAPLLLSLWWARSDWRGGVDPWRRAFLAGALLALAVGGAVVSLKIGGGSNLHNLDAYLVLLLVIGTSLLVRAPHSDPATRFHPALPPFRETALLVAVPVMFAVGAGGPWQARDLAAAEPPLALIRDKAQETAQDGERVLFISQRHLLTFDKIDGVPLEPEYETVFLMEMAMAGNRPYLDRFHSLLEERAFGLIVVDRLSSRLQGRTHSFGEENDAWVTEVSQPILCFYDVLVRLDQPPVDLLVPKAEAAGCSG